MARMIISFEMDNAAFDEDICGEAARVLQNLTNRIACGISPVTIIRDTNGNRIGQAEFYEGEL